MQPTGFIHIAASQFAQRHDTQTGLVADKNDFTWQRGQGVQQLVAFQDQALGVVEHQQVGQPEREAIDQQAAAGRGVVAQHPGQFEWFLDQPPGVGATLAMQGDAVVHFAVQGLAGGDIEDRQAAVAGEFFSQAAFAGARTAENQLTHGATPHKRRNNPVSR